MDFSHWPFGLVMGMVAGGGDDDGPPPRSGGVSLDRIFWAILPSAGVALVAYGVMSRSVEVMQRDLSDAETRIEALTARVNLLEQMAAVNRSRIETLERQRDGGSR